MIVGPQATELVNAGVIGITAEATIETLADSFAAHPTLAEALKEAALVALGRPIHLPPRAQAEGGNRGLMGMRASSYLLPTLKDDPADAEAISHRLLVRGGFVRQVGSGLYTYLPLGWRVMQRIAAMLREEMDTIAMEVSMPVLQPASLWQETGRYTIPEMFKLEDNSSRPYVLAMTHEEVFTYHAARELRSYRDLPQVWYQIQTQGARRAAAEVRHRAHAGVPDEGLLQLRPRQEALDASYRRHIDVYRRIYDRCGLRSGWSSPTPA